jgi:hypothetical protein
VARGGRRQGTPGQSYSNRSDLNANRAPTGPTATPAAAPVSQSGPSPVALPTQTAAAPSAGPAMPVPPPGSLGTFNPTQRPGEPLTHGLASGPGAGPEALPQTFAPDPIVQASAAFQSLPPAHQTPMMRALAAATQASVSNVSNPGVAPGGGQ